MGVMLVTSLEAEGWVDIGAEKILGGAGREVGGRIARRRWELRLRERMIRFKGTRRYAQGGSMDGFGYHIVWEEGEKKGRSQWHSCRLCGREVIVPRSTGCRAEGSRSPPLASQAPDRCGFALVTWAS